MGGWNTEMLQFCGKSVMYEIRYSFYSFYLEGKLRNVFIKESNLNFLLTAACWVTFLFTFFLQSFFLGGIYLRSAVLFSFVFAKHIGDVIFVHLIIQINKTARKRLH